MRNMVERMQSMRRRVKNVDGEDKKDSGENVKYEEDNEDRRSSLSDAFSFSFSCSIFFPLSFSSSLSVFLTSSSYSTVSLLSHLLHWHTSLSFLYFTFSSIFLSSSSPFFSYSPYFFLVQPRKSTYSTCKKHPPLIYIISVLTCYICNECACSNPFGIRAHQWRMRLQYEGFLIGTPLVSEPSITCWPGGICRLYVFTSVSTI